MSSATVFYLLPEWLLIAVATALYMGGAFLPRFRQGAWVALGGIVLAAVALYVQYDRLFWLPDQALPELTHHLTGPLAADLFGQYVRWLTLAVGLLLVMTSVRPDGELSGENLGSLLMALAGTMLVASARELVVLFLGLELLSIPTYVLLYLGRRDAASQESAVKYFFLSLLASAFLLFGFSYLYGAAGSTDLVDVYRVLHERAFLFEQGHLLAQVGFVLVVAGLGFRITAVPFQFYAPDVYQGTTNANAGVLSVLPKIVGFVALARLLVFAMPGVGSVGWRLVPVLAVATMTFGNVLALWQDNIRRLLAYSSIAHAGYMLIGLAVGLATAAGKPTTEAFDGIGPMLFYLSVYGLATAGTFAALTYLGAGEKQIDGIDELAGLGRTHPWTSLALAVFMFSLAGIPPLAGFWGKLSLFSSALGVQAGGEEMTRLQTWYMGLAIAGAVNAAIAAAYYLRIVAAMYFRPPTTTPKAQGGRWPAVAMALAAALVLLVGLYPMPLSDGSAAASAAAHRSAPGETPAPKVAVHAVVR